jgi:hypothetical protein
MLRWIFGWWLGTAAGGLVVKLRSAGEGAAGLNTGCPLILNRRLIRRH